MSTLYQDCANAIDALDGAIEDKAGTNEKQIILKAGETMFQDGFIEREKLKTIRILQNTFIGDGNIIKINELLKFCKQNDYRLTGYKQPDQTTQSHFTIETPTFGILVQAK